MAKFNIVTTSKEYKKNVQPDSSEVFFSKGISLHFPPFKAQLLFWPCAIIGLILDLWSKNAVFDWLRLKSGCCVSIVDGFFQLVMAENSGAAFGIAAGQRYLLIAASIAALIVIFVIFLFFQIRQQIVYLALGLFTAGVCGNLYDRLFNDGRVRDFIDIVYWPGKHWPAFNIADSMLCIAVGLMIISSLVTEWLGRKHAPQQK